MRIRIEAISVLSTTNMQNDPCLMLLLDHGADPNMMISYDNSVLAYCVAHRPQLTQQASLLLELGADPNKLWDNQKETPLMRALDQQDQAMVLLLLQHGANPCLRPKACIGKVCLPNDVPTSPECKVLLTEAIAKHQKFTEIKTQIAALRQEDGKQNPNGPNITT